VVDYCSSIQGRVSSSVSDGNDPNKVEVEDYKDYNEGTILLVNRVDDCLGTGKISMDNSKSPVFTGTTLDDF